MKKTIGNNEIYFGPDTSVFFNGDPDWEGDRGIGIVVFLWKWPVGVSFNRGEDLADLSVQLGFRALSVSRSL